MNVVFCNARGGFFSVGGDMFLFRRDIFELNIYIYKSGATLTVLMLNALGDKKHRR